MQRRGTKLKPVGERATQGIALTILLGLGAWALVGPSGFLAWSENNRLLIERQAEVKQLTDRRDELRNRVTLLDPRNPDSDLAGELLRDDLNVVHPDELVMPLD